MSKTYRRIGGNCWSNAFLTKQKRGLTRPKYIALSRIIRDSMNGLLAGKSLVLNSIYIVVGSLIVKEIFGAIPVRILSSILIAIGGSVWVVIQSIKEIRSDEFKVLSEIYTKHKDEKNSPNPRGSRWIKEERVYSIQIKELKKGLLFPEDKFKDIIDKVLDEEWCKLRNSWREKPKILGGWLMRRFI